MSSRLFRPAPILLALGLGLSALPAFASDISDVAREMRLPAPVAEDVFANVDAFFAAADAPANRQMTGVMKELALKAVRARLSDMGDAGPGKASDYSSEERNGTYKAQLRTTRHDMSETRDCVENRATLTASEAVPIIRDGSFTFDTTHPRISTYGWSMTFCRTMTGSGEFSAWSLMASR